MHDLRLVRGGLPGADRARRQHRRDPPQPGAGGEPLPEGAQRRLPQHGDRRQPVGPAEVARGSTGPRGWRSRSSAADAATGRRRRRPWRRSSHAAASCYWVGCAGAFDDRNRKVVRAMAQPSCSRPRCRSPCSARRETCTGDPARRAGNEYLFQMLAEENVATLTAAHDEHSVRTIVASCPHCFNTIRTSTRSSAWPASGDPPHPAAGHARRRGQARSPTGTTRRSSPTTTPATWAATTRSTTRGGAWWSRSRASRWSRWSSITARGCAAAPAARGCGWRSARGSGSTTAAWSRRWRTRPTAIATACPFCLIMLRDGTTDLDRADVAVRDVAELLADATGAWSLEVRDRSLSVGFRRIWP